MEWNRVPETLFDFEIKLKKNYDDSQVCSNVKHKAL